MDIFSFNGQLRPKDQATKSLYSIELSYGFGVYENVRVKDGEALFAEEHAKRLLKSAEIIDLEHPFNGVEIVKFINDLITAIEQTSYNLKILLLGGRTGEEAELYILPLSPKYPDRNLYKHGAKAITVEYERYLPNAKTLNMLPSYLAYREAQKAGAYDAILVNSRGEMVEGTRTNLFAVKQKQLFTPPESEILVGVTRTRVIKVAEQNEFSVHEGSLPLSDLENHDSYFLTSTSSKIMPISQIDDKKLHISDDLRALMQVFN